MGENTGPHRGGGVTTVTELEAVEPEARELSPGPAVPQPF